MVVIKPIVQISPITGTNDTPIINRIKNLGNLLGGFS